MKWYFWVLIVVAIAVIGYFVWKSQMKKTVIVLAEGSPCTIPVPSTATRTVGNSTILPINIVPIQGVISNGIFVSK